MNQEENYFQDTKSKFKQYVDKRMLLLRLHATEKASKLASALITITVIVVVALFLLIFLSFTAGYWLASLTGSLVIGFGIITLFYLIVFVFAAVFLRKMLQDFFINKFIYLLTKKD
jgi:energy-coupling factor transporter transmembrane protein EcfT